MSVPDLVPHDRESFLFNAVFVIICNVDVNMSLYPQRWKPIAVTSL